MDVRDQPARTAFKKELEMKNNDMTEVLSTISELKQAGQTKEAIAGYLNRQGYKTANGKKFKFHTIAYLLGKIEKTSGSKSPYAAKADIKSIANSATADMSDNIPPGVPVTWKQNIIQADRDLIYKYNPTSRPVETKSESIDTMLEIVSHITSWKSVSADRRLALLKSLLA